MLTRTRLAILAAMAWSGWYVTLDAQEAREPSADDAIRFDGIQVEVGAITSGRLKGATQVGLRVDLGRFAPKVRVLAGVSYFRSDFKASEIQEFVTALARVVDDPEGNFTIDLGRVRWGDVALDLDFQYLPGTWGGGRWQPYLGLGASVHFRNGSGTAIDGTFVEDALDNISAGVNITAGWDIALARGLIVNVGGRAVLASDLRTLGLQVGLGYRVPRSSP